MKEENFFGNLPNEMQLGTDPLGFILKLDTLFEGEKGVYQIDINMKFK